MATINELIERGWVQDPVTFAFRPPKEGETQGENLRQAAQGPTASSASVTIGEHEDYYAMVVQLLNSMGITEGTAERLGFLSDATVDGLALAKMDAASIRDQFANDQRVIDINPGAPFGLSKSQYDENVAGLRSAEKSVYGKEVTDFSKMPKDRQAREQSGAGLALKERTDPKQYASELERFRQERGKTPNAQEIQERRARPDRGLPRPTFQPPQRREEEEQRPAVLRPTTSTSSVRPARRK